MDLAKLLNKEQYEAATTINGSLLILAGAGSGKTRVLTYRIAHMIKDLNIYPSQILAITFTNKAAGEMRDRVRKLVGNTVDTMWISTFHSCCVRILRREADKIDFNKNFTIYDSDDQKTLIKQCMKELNINEKDINEKEIVSKISSQKDRMISAEQFKSENQFNYRMNKIADVYVLYQKKLKSFNAMDFDDLIIKTVELFKKNDETLKFYQRKFKYIMVDEYQDTNATQYQLVKLLAYEHKNICVVGDDDQCIYEWRGADIRNILDFEKDYPDCKVIKLEQNYRSVGNILSAANHVIVNNCNRKSKVLRTDMEDGEKIKIFRASTDIQECNFAANEIKKLKENENKDYRDFAILYRTNAQSRLFEQVFIKQGIPYKIVGGLKFFERKEIKDIMAYLKLINNPLDDISLRRIINVPKRNIGETTVQKIQQFANEMDESLFNTLLDIENLPGLTSRSTASINKFIGLINSFIIGKDNVLVSKLIEEVIKETGYLDDLKKSGDVQDLSRIENLEELISDAMNFENSSEDKSLAAYLEKSALFADTDELNEEDNVEMMTIHSAKGLEFPVVFMVGMENGIFPGMASLLDEGEMEESRRLCYVGITRAKEKLYMTSSERRVIFGRDAAYEPSEFLSEIPGSLIDNIENEIPISNAYSAHYGNKYSGRHNDFSREISIDNQAYISDSPTYEKPSPKLCTKLNAEEAVMGKRVKHPKFGLGTIISVTKDGKDIKLTIAFENMGIKYLLLDAAPLETA